MAVIKPVEVEREEPALHTLRADQGVGHGVELAGVPTPPAGAGEVPEGGQLRPTVGQAEEVVVIVQVVGRQLFACRPEKVANCRNTVQKLRNCVQQFQTKFSRQNHFIYLDFGATRYMGFISQN